MLKVKVRLESGRLAERCAVVVIPVLVPDDWVRPTWRSKATDLHQDTPARVAACLDLKAEARFLLDARFGAFLRSAHGSCRFQDLCICSCSLAACTPPCVRAKAFHVSQPHTRIVAHTHTHTYVYTHTYTRPCTRLTPTLNTTTTTTTTTVANNHYHNHNRSSSSKNSIV